MSLVNWKLEKDLCRCCHSEGVFKNLAEPCCIDGQEESYCDMLQAGLDITLTPVLGPLCAITFTICEDCILRLRDVCSFKQQVTKCEQRFQNLYNRDIIKAASGYEGLPAKEVVPEHESIKVHISRLDEVEDFRIDFDNEDDPVYEIKKLDFKEKTKEQPKRPRPRKPKPREKAKNKKAVGRPRKLKVEEDKSKATRAEEEKKVIKVQLTRLEDENDFGIGYENKDNKQCEIKKLDITEEQPKKPRPKKLKVKEKVKKKKTASKVKVVEEKSKEKNKKEAKKGKNTHTENQYTILEDSEGKVYGCNLCARLFTKLVLFSQHYRHVHLKLRPKLRSCYLCDIRVPGHLRARHLEEVHAVQRPMCNACGKKFSYPFQVTRHHQQFHMNEELHPCSQCDKKFTLPSQLKRHLLTHSATRMFKCEYCAKAFRWKKNLQTHVMIHKNDKRHVCVVCKEAFVQHTSLKYHLKKKHPDSV